MGVRKKEKKILIPVYVWNKKEKGIANQSRLSPATWENKGLQPSPETLKWKGGISWWALPATHLFPLPEAGVAKFSTSESAPLLSARELRMLHGSPQPWLCGCEYNSGGRRGQLTGSWQQWRDECARQRGRHRKTSRGSEQGRRNSPISLFLSRDRNLIQAAAAEKPRKVWKRRREPPVAVLSGRLGMGIS